MLRIALQGLRGRKGPFAGAFVALAIAAALVMACGALLQAGVESHAPVERLAAAPIVVAGDQKAKINVGTQNEDHVALYERARVPAALVPRVAAVQGVRAAIADHAVPAELDGHGAEVHSWATVALSRSRLASGRAPAGRGEIVVGAGRALHVGQRVRLAANGPVRTTTVVGIATGNQGSVFVSDAVAARLVAQPDRVDSIGVLLDPGADAGAVAKRIRTVLDGRARVVTGTERGDVEHIETIEEREAVIAIAATFGSLALLIAMFVVASTIGLSVLQREREVALLRAVAATPKQVRRMVRWEALVVGLVAAGVGIVPGALLAHAMGGALADRGIAPENLHVTTGLVPVIVAVGSSVLTALVAVMAAGRRAARVQPTRALQDSTGEARLIGPLRLLLGLVALGGSVALLAVTSTSHDEQTVGGAATGLSLTLVIAVALLGPLLVRIVAWSAALVLGRRGRAVGAFLAVSNLRTSSARFASAMTPLVLTIALSSTLLFQTTTREHATADQGAQRVTADLVLQSDGAGIPRAAVDEARRIAGVDAAVATGSTTLGPSLGATQQPIPAAVVDPRGMDRVLALDVRSGSLAAMRDDDIALSQSRADIAHAAVGDRVRVMLGDGAVRRVRVAAIYKRGLGFGEVVLPTAVAAAHRTTPLADAVLIATDSPRAVAPRLRALAARYPGLTVGDRHDLAATADQNRAADDWLFRVIAAIVFAFTAIAVVNTLLMIALHRTRELALLQLVGATARQVRSMARWEAGVVVALGLGLGGAIALITLIPASDVLTGSPVPYAPLGLLALVFGAAAALAFGGSQLATRLAMRARPADGIGLRD